MFLLGGENFLEFSEFSCFKKLMFLYMKKKKIMSVKAWGGGLKALADTKNVSFGGKVQAVNPRKVPYSLLPHLRMPKPTSTSDYLF